MGRVRSALRAYALETSDPADIMTRLEHKLQYFEPDVMVTVLCAVFSPCLDRVRISSAGHLPPVLVRPGQPGEPASIVSDVMIGVPVERSRHATAVAFPPGAMLCLYTDGLVERRDRPIDAGIARLTASLTPSDPDTACARVMAAMADSSPHSDDVALLILRRDPTPGSRPDASSAGGAA